MLSAYNIWTVARIEAKTLLRSWFFRIFAGLSIVLLVFFNLAMFTDVFHVPWMFRGISSSIPYMNILLLNVVQAVVAIFLSSEFLKRDRKLDTTEVVYMRSMTNGDYVLGKTFGILFMFIALNLIILLIAAIFNVFFSGVPVVLRAYLFYPLLISVPTIVFILGLSFLLMVLIRNQAVTLIVLLGYIATTLFFLSSRVHYLFDYMAFNVPLMYSGFIGFGNLPEILVHRGIYLFFGASFVLITILAIKRLPQSRIMNYAFGVLAVLFFAAAFALCRVYTGRISGGMNLREKMDTLNSELIDAPRVTPLRCELDLVHSGKEIQAKARITFINGTRLPVDGYIFSLNPGLEVRDVRDDRGELGFERDMHVLRIKPSIDLGPGAADSLTISYGGSIDENACYLDIDEKSREKRYRITLYNVDKRHGFIEPGFLLLTPENLWYPVACAMHSSELPGFQHQDFIEFHLSVKTEHGLTAVSQGGITDHGGGRYSFSPEFPLPGLSLVIGRYERRSIEVDSLSYNLFTLEGHDYFKPYFNELGDTLEALIREFKDDFERKLELSYPYPRLKLVEVPVQFFSYGRLWTVRHETVQPEMVLLPEKGVALRAADFKRRLHRRNRRGRQSNQTFTQKEIQGRVLQQFVQSVLAGNIVRREFREGGANITPSRYNIFPNYFTFINYAGSAKWPVLNMALESFIASRIESQADPSYRNFGGVTAQEKANLALKRNNLSEILSNEDEQQILKDVLKSKGSYLFALLQSELGEEVFKDYLSGLLEENRFRALEAERLVDGLMHNFGLDMAHHVEDWYRGRQLPGFILWDTRAYQVMDNERTRFQVRFKVSNTQAVEGLLHVSFRVMGRRRFAGTGGDDSGTERIVAIEENQTKEIGFVLDYKPGIMTVNTLISVNVPSVLNESFMDFDLDKNAQPFDGERIIDVKPPVDDPGEIVVDNEDAGFEVSNRKSGNFLRVKFRRSSKRDEGEYSGIHFWNPPGNWTAVTHSDFYGKYIRSAYYTKAGKGEVKVAWNSSIPESGYYDVYCFTSKLQRPWGRGREKDLGQYRFIVYHDDGVEDVTLDINSAQDGWNFLGSYFLSAGDAKVELTNESSGKIVFADAVKWVGR